MSQMRRGLKTRRRTGMFSDVSWSSHR